jgi:hypothetical protein
MVAPWENNYSVEVGIKLTGGLESVKKMTENARGMSSNPRRS